MTALLLLSGLLSYVFDCVVCQGDEKIRFGLKVFVKCTSPPIVDGIKAVAHAVIEMANGKYRDPSPELDETRIMFIPVPDMFSQTQIDEIVDSPEDVRMGIVLCNVQDSAFSDKVFEVEPATKLMCAPCAGKVRVYKANMQRGEVYEICRDGSRVAI